MLVVSERRRSNRKSAGHRVEVCDSKGGFVTAGRAANFSEHGAFLIIEKRPGLSVGDELVVKLQQQEEGEALSTTAFRCRVIRLRVLGGLLGLGVEFTEEQK